MVKGETFDLQLFESEAFRHFINVFTNKQSGVTLGCTVTKNSQNITVAPGYFFIQGGLLKEETGTENEIPSEAGYYKLVYEIDLSKTNQKDVFNQGSYKFIRSVGGYPSLTQEDLDNGGTIYQLPFCQFRITDQGIQDFKDIREKIDYGIYEEKANKGSIMVWNDSDQKIFTGHGFTFLFNKSDIEGELFEVRDDGFTIKVLKDCRAYISSKIFIEETAGNGYIQSSIKINDSVSISNALEMINNQSFAHCNDSGVIYDLKEGDLILLRFDYTAGDSTNPAVRSGFENSNISIFAI